MPTVDPEMLVRSAMALAAEAGARGDPPSWRPDLGVADLFGRAQRPPRVTAGVLAPETSAQIAAFRDAIHPLD